MKGSPDYFKRTFIFSFLFCYNNLHRLEFTEALPPIRPQTAARGVPQIKGGIRYGTESDSSEDHLKRRQHL